MNLSNWRVRIHLDGTHFVGCLPNFFKNLLPKDTTVCGVKRYMKQKFTFYFGGNGAESISATTIRHIAIYPVPGYEQFARSLNFQIQI